MRRAPTADAYDLYRAALEWSLDDPIVIDNRDDLKSETKWRDLVEPYEHQVTNLITFCRRLPVTLLADDVGLGKTISAGLVASELMARKRVTRLLVICPKILGPQWKEELETKFGIPSVIAVGGDLTSTELRDDRYAVITTYNSARLHLRKVPEDRFQMLVLDEAHKLRNLHGVDNPPKIAQIILQVLKDRFFKYVLMLTATPIQNRLWDLYSLVDLLSTARGHENPFGTPGLFKRQYIADAAAGARHLKLEAKDQFRSIVYSYMSRIRRGDAHLIFPDRQVLLHPVAPAEAEIELLNFIARPIQELNPLAQIGILKAFTSSPYALLSFLESMARNKTAPPSLAIGAKKIVQSMSSFAKLDGLANLVSRIRRERPHDWRLVIFTTSRETQTSIESLLKAQKVNVETINGQSGYRNQETLRKFRASPPEINAIVSTEAGAEGVNLQAANILVNFDLPWNPMIVEQRVGRIQRLGSIHKSVSIYNLVLARTFDEFIVGRLMEKLQLASHAIGDIEALLETAGIDDEEENESFEEKIRKLVVASLAGQNVEMATQQELQSIERAKATLVEQEKTINSLLGNMGDIGVTGPRSPTLPALKRTMTAREFALVGLRHLGTVLTDRPDGCFLARIEGRSDVILVEGTEVPPDVRYVDYRPGSPAFDRLATRLSIQPLHLLSDHAIGQPENVDRLVRQWVATFGGVPSGTSITSTKTSFQGETLVRARAFVAHDSYERLIRIECDPEQHSITKSGQSSVPKSEVVELGELGLNPTSLQIAIEADEAIEEFSRFYVERRADEVTAAGIDARKAKKLEEEYTPRLEATVVGVRGRVGRCSDVSVKYRLETSYVYTSTLSIASSQGQILEMPHMKVCALSKKHVPVDCLATCEISDLACLKELLVKSEHSGRQALPEYVTNCALTGKKVLIDEVEASDVSGKYILKHLLRVSAVSGRKAAPSECGQCEFTSAVVLLDELKVSEVSDRHYRIDRQRSSDLSGRTGDRSEFVDCEFSNKCFLPDEGVRCELTGKLVAPGILQKCDVTGKMVVPTELKICAESGRVAVSNCFALSSVSGTHFIREYAVTSIGGKICRPSECEYCFWSGEFWHPDDVRDCSLTQISVHVEYTIDQPPKLKSLAQLLDGENTSIDVRQWWPIIESAFVAKTGNEHGQITNAVLSPSRRLLACTMLLRSMMGFKKRFAGFVFSLEKKRIVGGVVVGKRSNGSWSAV